MKLEYLSTKIITNSLSKILKLQVSYDLAGKSPSFKYQVYFHV